MLDLDDLLTSWLRRLKGERKSRHTIASYGTSVRSFLAFCRDTGRPVELSRDNVVAYMGSRSGEVSTARLNLSVLKIFARWIATEEDYDPSEVLSVRAPKPDQRSVPDLTDNEVARLLKACEGTELRDKRDKALVALFAETGLRAAEMLALDVADVDLDRCVVHVKRGKGGKGRYVHFSVGTASVLDRYTRARHRAVLRPTAGPLWVSAKGERLTYTGMHTALKARAADAGIIGFHMHRLRHTAAVRWLRAGGTETGLMAHAGWTSTAMVGRYVKAASEDLAGEEFTRLGLGVVDL
ncbi:tyrosine-type recombinase/integrase [Mycobacterium lehmannii]|uniref:tyrosine-type recombinase/integrase n=1 Tax=Mycobacterium lehmannii TaxID=2048550 RepID=UPI000B93DDAA|nr:tyrosine-type recombinase/integrase [Mycobacterium lehmannii]